MSDKPEDKKQDEEIVKGSVAANESAAAEDGQDATLTTTQAVTCDIRLEGDTQMPGCDTTDQPECEDTWDCPPEGTEDCENDPNTYDCVTEDTTCPSDDPAQC